MNSWDRQDGEPNLWFSRFAEFRLLGPSRSILSVYNSWRERVGKGSTAKRVPNSWNKAVKKWRWVERAEAFDEAERESEQSRYEADRLEWRQKRRQLLGTFFEKLEAALAGYDPSEASLRPLTQAVKVSLHELRTEYRDAPIAQMMLLNIDLASLSDEQLRRISTGEDPALVLANSSKS